MVVISVDSHAQLHLRHPSLRLYPSRPTLTNCHQTVRHPSGDPGSRRISCVASTPFSFGVLEHSRVAVLLGHGDGLSAIAPSRFTAAFLTRLGSSAFRKIALVTINRITLDKSAFLTKAPLVALIAQRIRGAARHGSLPPATDPPSMRGLISAQ